MSKYLRAIAEGLIIGAIVTLLSPAASFGAYLGLCGLVLVYGTYRSYMTSAEILNQTSQQSSYDSNNKAQNG